VLEHDVFRPSQQVPNIVATDRESPGFEEGIGIELCDIRDAGMLIALRFVASIGPELANHFQVLGS
jgi:hypothetical protein